MSTYLKAWCRCPPRLWSQHSRPFLQRRESTATSNLQLPLWCDKQRPMDSIHIEPAQHKTKDNFCHQYKRICITKIYFCSYIPRPYFHLLPNYTHTHTMCSSISSVNTRSHTNSNRNTTLSDNKYLPKSLSPYLTPDTCATINMLMDYWTANNNATREREGAREIQRDRHEERGGMESSFFPEKQGGEKQVESWIGQKLFHADCSHIDIKSRHRAGILLCY